MRPQHPWLICAVVALTACADGSQTMPSTTLASVDSPSSTVGDSDGDAGSDTTPTTAPAPIYVLQAGDTPSGVAERFGLSVDELDEYNAGLSGYERFIVGAVIWVGAPPTSVPQEPVKEFKPTADLAVLTFTGAVVPDDEILNDNQLAIFSRVYPHLNSADVTVCHLADQGVGAEAAAAVRETLGFVGYDLCTTAGPTEAIGDDTVRPTGFDINGIEVAVLSYAADSGGVLDTEEVSADVARVRDAGAEVVAVVVDWGPVQNVQPSAAEQAVVAEIIAGGGVDLVVGHAPVLRPVEEIDGVWVAWGLGGMLSAWPTGGGWPAQTDDAAILTVRFNREFDGSIAGADPTLVATWCDRADGHVVRLLADMGDAALSPEVRVALQRAAERSRATLGALLAD